MRRRCYNPNNPEYKNYGGRGIKVCECWQNSFKNFMQDMGERPSLKHSLDRKNNDGDYEPTNCRWTTSGVQIVNQRPRQNKTGWPGVYKVHNRWCARFRGKKVGWYSTAEDAGHAYQNAKSDWLNSQL